MRHVVIIDSLPGRIMAIGEGDEPEFRRIGSVKGHLIGGYINRKYAEEAAEGWRIRGHTVKVRPYSRAQHGEWEDV